MISINTLKTFFKSPLNVVGFAMAIATAADTAYVDYVNHTIQWATFLGGEASGLFLMIFPDATQVSTDIRKIITDGLLDWASKDPSSLASLLADIVKLIEDSSPPTTPPVTTSVVSNTTTPATKLS